MAKVKNRKIHVLFASSEAVPFYKVGGLGDYSGSLPKALLNLPHIPLKKNSHFRLIQDLGLSRDLFIRRILTA